MASLFINRTTSSHPVQAVSMMQSFFSCSRASFTTTSRSLKTRLNPHISSGASQPIHHPSQRPSRSSIALVARRAYSASSSFSPFQIRTATTSASSSASPAVRASQTLTWNEFFVIRQRRRLLNTGLSITCAIAAAIFGTPLIGELDLDTKISEALGGADTMAILAAGGLTIAVVGWFAGRVLGATLFRLWASQRGWRQVFLEKEKSFFDRVKRYRADPASSSPQNPVPDYYGEKIGSVTAYRTWLKDQRAFNKKMYRGLRT